MERVLLSSFVIKIKDRRDNDQIINRFNGSDDFFNTFVAYLNRILGHIVGVETTSDNTSLHITLAEPPVVDPTQRVIYGYFSSGVSGERYMIKDINSNAEVLNVTEDLAAFRDIFFYVQLPLERVNGALILQRKSKFGIKTMLKKSINSYIREEGYQNYKVHLNNILHRTVYNRMMRYGKLKKVEFIRHRIPNNLDQYFQNGGNPEMIPGTFKLSMLSSSSLPQEFRNFVHRLFTNPDLERIEIEGVDDNYDEVEFELELNGKKKTFYVENKNRIQPDIDVTEAIVIENGAPTLASLVRQAQEIVEDIVNIRPSHVL